LSAAFHTVQPLIGGTGGNSFTHACGSDEVMIGVIASTYNDQWEPNGGNSVAMGNFGVICAPVLNSVGNYLQYDYATVLTATSWDTGFTYSIDSGASPARLNRYVSTILSSGLDLRPFTRQEAVVCPAGFAVSSLKLILKYAKVRGISEIRCRSVFGSQQIEPMLLVYPRMGGAETGTTSAVTSCPAGTVASGAIGRAGWFTDAIGLRCRN
jgi:hypothetical protein